MTEDNQQENKNEDSLGEKRIYARISPVSAGFLGLIGGFFLYQFVGGAMHLLIFGMDIENASPNGIRLITMAGQILFILLPALIFSRLVYEDVTEIIRFRSASVKEILLFGFGIILLTPLLQYFLYIQNYYILELAKRYDFINSLKALFDSMNEMVESAYGNLLRVNNIFEGMLVVLVIAVVPAVCEEIMFRGYIQKSFELKMKPVWAALLTAIFFGLFHFNIYGLIPLIALGFYFGFAAYISNSIMIPVILHFINNFSALAVYFVVGDDELINTAPDPGIGLGSSVFMFFFFLLLFLGTIAVIRKYYAHSRKI